jgi:RHS repeat-associated protein
MIAALRQFLTIILSAAIVLPSCIPAKVIASDPSARGTANPGCASGITGAVGYTYDPVGNRTQKTSTLPGYPGGLTNYNANDQLATDTYDAAGNTTASNGVGYVYDFENHLVQAGGGISYVYDGDGNRVSKTVASVTTTYLVADDNPTGYAQVLEEDDSTGGMRQYIYGLNLISRLDVSTGQSIYYVYDGHGSVRALTNSTGAVTDTYDYYAFGVLLHRTGSTPNNYLFAGEQFDPDLNLYYNRARYLNVSTGRFWSMDTYKGNAFDPVSLHRYLYASANPVNRLDKSGLDDLEEEEAAAAGQGTIRSMATVVFRNVIGYVYSNLNTLPLLVEKGVFWLTAGTIALGALAKAPTALLSLARSVENYNGPKFPAGNFPRGIDVGRAAGQNLGDRFPVLDNFDFQSGETTQIFSTTQVNNPTALVAAIRSKASAFQQAFDSRDTFTGLDSDGLPVTIQKSSVTKTNMLVVTPRIGSFSLTQIAGQLAQIEAESGLDEILIQESEALEGSVP